MKKSKVLKYCLFGFVYVFLVLEILWMSGIADPRCLFWPSTPGNLIGMQMSSRYFARYGYRFERGGATVSGWQFLPLFYRDTLKPGQSIRVHYDNDDLEKSFFEPGFNASVAFVILFVVLLGIFLLVIPFLAWTGARFQKIDDKNIHIN